MKIQILAFLLLAVAVCLIESTKKVPIKPHQVSYHPWVTQMMNSICACCKRNRRKQNAETDATSFAVQSEYGRNCYDTCKKYGAKCCQGLKYNPQTKFQRRPYSVTQVRNACHPRANGRRVNYCCCIDCQAQPADIIFVLDNSGSISSSEYTQMMNFVTSVVGAVEVGPTKKHVGVITFASDAQIRFHLNVHMSNAAVIGALGYTRQSGGTNTPAALQAVRTSMVTVPSPARTGVAKFVIIITDGHHPANTVTEANLLKAVPGVTIFAVGVGAGANIAELNAIASSPSSDHVFSATSFSDLAAIKEKLVDGLCE